MLQLFTDYGLKGPYVGQLKTALAAEAPGVAVIDLMHDAPAFNAHAGAHLLSALAPYAPPGCTFLAVVDPGVGMPRAGAVVEADGRWYVGPDNGLLSIVGQRAASVRYWRIEWRPEHLSDSFHGRDLFAPIAGAIAAGRFPVERLSQTPSLEVEFEPGDLPRILYVDDFGNAWTGIRGVYLADDTILRLKGRALPYRRVFAEAEKGECFWYVNSVGLVEIAANRGSAAELLGLKIGDPVSLSGPPGSRSH